MADPTFADTPQGSMIWRAQLSGYENREFQNLPSPFHAALGLASGVHQEIIEFDPPVQSVTFHYSMAEVNALWGGEFQYGVDSMFVKAGIRNPGTIEYFWHDGAKLRSNATSWQLLDTWTQVTLTAPWDAIGVLWFDGGPIYIDDLTIMRTAPPAIVCDTVVRGSPTTCRIQRTVDEVLAWTFTGQLEHRLFQPETVTIADSTPSITWEGIGIMSGSVSADVIMNGAAVRLTGSLEVLNRSGASWSWGETDWGWTDSVPTANSLCEYGPFYLSDVQQTGVRLAVNRWAADCDATGRTLHSIQPSHPDSAHSHARVPSGPNAGLWYVTSATFYMDRTAEMNPFLGRFDTLRTEVTDGTDVRVCTRNAGTTLVNFWEYNELCRKFSLGAFYTALWKHEGFGTQGTTDLAVANGHEARRWGAAALPGNDPLRVVEGIVNPDSQTMIALLRDSIFEADDRIRVTSGSHSYVKDNYIQKNKCGTTYVWDPLDVVYKERPMTSVDSVTNQVVCM